MNKNFPFIHLISNDSIVDTNRTQFKKGMSLSEMLNLGSLIQTVH